MEEAALSNEASELVSDRVGLPPTLGFCGGGLGGGALGLDGRVVAMEAGRLACNFFVEATGALIEAVVLVFLPAFFRGVMGGGGWGALFFLFWVGDSMMAFVTVMGLGVVSVGVASFDRHTGSRLEAVLTSKLDCKMGPEMSNFVS